MLILFIKLLNSNFINKIRIFSNYNLQINNNKLLFYKLNLFFIVFNYKFNNIYNNILNNNIYKFNVLLLFNNNILNNNNIYNTKKKTIKNKFNYINDKFYYINNLNFNSKNKNIYNLFKFYHLNSKILNNKKKFINFFNKNKQSLAFINLYRAI
jgi:hypothetical protein